MMKLFTILAAFILFFAQSVQAEESAVAPAASHVYAPEGCEFRLTFPGEPYVAKKCDPDNPDKCSNLTSYTKVFGLEATVNFNVTCNPAEEKMYDRYSGEIMKATLEAMVGKNLLENYETGFEDFKTAKQAMLLGTGRAGVSEKLYVMQLWIGHKSVFTVEGELIGEQIPEAEEMFAQIMRSAVHESWLKDGAAAPAPDGEKEPEKTDEKTEQKQPQEPAAPQQ